LGAATRVDSITIHWPSGKTDSLGPESVDQELVVQEGHGVLARHAGAPTTSKPTESRLHLSHRAP
jgi:hypothetical protein